jgi:small subunit ribosomal protein S20
MANTPQAKKRARQNERRAAINKARRSRIRTFLRAVEEAATAALRAAQPELMRGVTKGIFHKNTVSRKVSRLSARVKAIA